jgi:hypothetical protein
MLFFTQGIYDCNRLAWSLRPDNVYLLIQMMVSDIMLALNFHGSEIGGASNGIGGTIVVRDGGGNYRTLLRKEPGSMDNGSHMLQLYSKKNGSGADMCVSLYKMYVELSGYSDKCVDHDIEVFSELKRTTELGLLQECCNIVEKGNNGACTQVHTAKETCTRRYSTELKSGNDLQSNACMQAISWLVVRQTVGLDVNCFATTKEDDKKKGRVSVEYRQVMYGYWVICTNAVGYLSR